MQFRSPICAAAIVFSTAAVHGQTPSEFYKGRTVDVYIGTSVGGGYDTYVFPKIANAVLHTRFKLVTGYPGGNDVDLAMERGEVEGRCGWSWTSVKGTHQAWLDRKDIRILFQMGLSKHPDLPEVPLIMD